MTVIDAWVAGAAKQKFSRQQVDLGPLGAEEVEVEVEHCGLCHSDLSVLNNEWGISKYPAVLGHEVVGRVVAVGSAAKGHQVGQRVGVGWNAGSCMHCRQCLSGDHHLCLAGTADDRRPSRRICQPRPLALGLDDPAAGVDPTSPRSGRCCAAASRCSIRWPCTPSRPAA